MFSESVVIDDTDLAAIAVFPDEAEPPLVVDADAVLSFPVSLQGFQPIGRRDAQIFEMLRVVQHTKFAPCDFLNVRRQSPGTLAQPDRFGFLVGEIENHAKP